MDEDEFIEQYKDNTNKANVMSIVYGELVEYCREHNITGEDISTKELENVARRMIKEGEF